MVKFRYGKNIYGRISVYLWCGIRFVCLLSGMAHPKER